MGQSTHRGTQQETSNRELHSARLDSWKEIAVFLHRDARTVRRWERDRKLPVHRVPGGERGGVFAYVSELELWLHAARALREAPEPGRNMPGETSQPASIVRDIAKGVEREGNAAKVESAGLQSHLLEVTADTPSALHLIHTVPANFVDDSAAAFGQQTSDVDIRSTQAMNHSWTLGQRPSGHMVPALLLLLTVSIGATVLLARHGHSVPGAQTLHVPNPAAQDLYLRGRYYWNLRTEEGLNQAVDLFTQAIVSDPNYAAAYTGLADSYLLLREFGHMPDAEAYPRALAATRQAIALDDSCPEAHRSLAFILRFWNWDMPAAEREYRRAIELNPSDAQSHHWYATALLSSGRIAEAQAEIDVARSFEPQSISVLADRGLILAAADPSRGVEALSQVEQAQPDFSSAHVYLADTFLRLGEYDKFMAEAETAAALSHDSAALEALETAERSLPTHGMKPALSKLASDFARLAQQGSQPAYTVARLFALTGQTDSAMRYLRLSYDRREPAFLVLDHDPVFEPVHASPEFLDLMARGSSTYGSRRDPIARLDLPRPF